MGLMDEIKAERSGPPPKCPLYKLTAIMEETDLNDLMAAVRDMTISAAAISRVLERKGYTLKNEAIGRHRRGECGCRG